MPSQDLIPYRIQRFRGGLGQMTEFPPQRFTGEGSIRHRSVLLPGADTGIQPLRGDRIDAAFLFLRIFRTTSSTIPAASTAAKILPPGVIFFRL